MIEIIGAPFDLCGMRLGSRLGPAAVRLAGLHEALTALDLETKDSGDVAVGVDDGEVAGMRAFGPLLQTVKQLCTRTGDALAGGNLPLVLGGEHTLVVGGISAALAKYGPNLGLLWIDAHADINTPGSSTTGNIHGMPIAALAGCPSETDGEADLQWRDLLEVLGPERLDLRNVAWYGLRDVDPAERECLKGMPITMHDIDRHGVEETVRRCHDWFVQRGVTHLWISFDVDALDPVLAPGTGTAVRGGLSYREGHLLAELLAEHLAQPQCPYRLVGVDVVETNPLYDTMNATAVMAVEWIASLFGKTILGRR